MRLFDCCPPLCSRQNGIQPGLWLSRPMKNMSRVPKPYYYNDGFRGEVIPTRKLDLPQRRCDPSMIAAS